MPAGQRSQVGLPLRVGGCGVRCPMRIRPAARIAALAAYYTEGAKAVGAPPSMCQPRAAWIQPAVTELQVKQVVNFDPVTAWQGRLELITSATKDHCQQKWWSEAIGRKVMETLLQTSSPRDQARLLEQATGVGSSFMSAPPSEALKTIFPSDSYRLTLQWWLGLAVMELEDGRKCPGGQSGVDEFGDHLLCCIRNNFSTRHGAMQERLYSVLVEAGQSVERETVVDSPDGRRLRPADLKLNFWEGKDVAVDLTICHGWQASERLRSTANLEVSRERWRAFLKRQEAAKHAKYDKACSDAGWGFRAMAFGTWGGVGPEGAKLLHRITKRAAGWLEGDLRARRQEEIRHSVGVVLMQHICTMLQSKNFI